MGILSSIAVLGVVGLILAIGIAAQSPTETQSTTETTTQSQLSEKVLLDGINKKREANGLNALEYEKSTCALAQNRVEEIFEKGIDVFSNNASFQRAIDKVFEDDPSINPELTPGWYQEFLTYQETNEDALNTWNDNDTKVIFTDPKYQFGCVAEKDGYAVLVIGFNEEEDEPTDKTYYQLDTPKDLEKTSAISI